MPHFCVEHPFSRGHGTRKHDNIGRYPTARNKMAEEDIKGLKSEASSLFRGGDYLSAATTFQRALDTIGQVKYITKNMAKTETAYLLYLWCIFCILLAVSKKKIYETWMDPGVSGPGAALLVRSVSFSANVSDAYYSRVHSLA